MNHFVYLLLFILSVTTSYSQQTSIEDIDTCKWHAPTTVTSDCQFGNDYQFQVTYNCPLAEYNLTIFNRWGEVMFESNDISETWDATHVPEETYVWRIQGTYMNEEIFDASGHFSKLD